MATVARLHVKGTPFEQQVEQALATKYLADPKATSESFFEPKLKTLKEITNGVQGVLPPDKKTAWPRPKPKPAAAVK